MSATGVGHATVTYGLYQSICPKKFWHITILTLVVAVRYKYIVLETCRHNIFSTYIGQKMFETINFCISLSAIFWDKPPAVKISIDGAEKFMGEITANGLSPAEVVFSQNLQFHQTHTLSLYRYNKTSDQCLKLSDNQHKDQLLIINGLWIDDVDVRHLIWTRSQFEPIYPEPWKSQQLKLGEILESTVAGESILGHNGIWRCSFTSPFWQFLLDNMDQ